MIKLKSLFRRGPSSKYSKDSTSKLQTASSNCSLSNTEGGEISSIFNEDDLNNKTAQTARPQRSSRSTSATANNEFGANNNHVVGNNHEFQDTYYEDFQRQSDQNVDPEVTKFNIILI